MCLTSRLVRVPGVLREYDDLNLCPYVQRSVTGLYLIIFLLCVKSIMSLVGVYF